MISLDVDSNQVSGMALIFNVESCLLKLLDNERQSVNMISKEYTIIYVYNEYDMLMIEYSLITLRLLETNVTYLVGHVLIPYMTSLFLTIEICKEFLNIDLRVPMFGFDTRWEFLIHVTFDWCLGVCLYEVYLLH